MEFYFVKLQNQKSVGFLVSGAGGIRTPGTLTSSMVFETISFNRSDTAPAKQIILYQKVLKCKEPGGEAELVFYKDSRLIIMGVWISVSYG